MEFGIIIQSPVPKMWRDGTPEPEHQSLMNDLDYVIAAEKAGFKYAWATEHHFLDEYSHLSENSVTMGYLAHATTKIHIGSAIFNPLPQVNHPAKVAERVAMLDHYSNGRFEFGTGRGAGTHEILGFLPGMRDLSHTREIWEDVIAEFPKMWMMEEYPGYEGKYWTLPPRRILPKPYVKPHPAMWYAAGNVSSWEMAASKGLGILGFSVQTLDDLAKVIGNYKKIVANCDPVGAFANDNIMVMGVPFVCADPKRARELARVPNEYFLSLVYRYHDTFPHPEGIPFWPETLPAPDDAGVEAIAQSMDPDAALATCKAWEAAGADQLVFAPQLMPKADVLESIRLIGEHIIPKIDTDPVHRTDRLRGLVR